jgi:DNA-binding CsgD family transcriptional regulator
MRIQKAPMTTWHPTTPAWYLETAERVCTPKQLEVLQLFSRDLSDKTIANELGLTRQAVWQRRTTALEKTAVELRRIGIIKGAA